MVTIGAPLVSCVSSSPQPVAWQQHQLTVSKLERWHLRSKFGYVTDSDSGSAWLDWEQIGDQANAHISGPFGTGAAQVISSNQGAILKRAGEADFHADSAGELTHYLFGWPFPLEQLRYWVRGLPAPGIPVTTLATNPEGLLSRLEQDGWVLAFTRYQNTSAGPLPSKIEASTGSLQIKLIIKEWQLKAALSAPALPTFPLSKPSVSTTKAPATQQYQTSQNTTENEI